MPGDNYRFDITSDNREHFNQAMKFAFDNCSGGKAHSYSITPKHGLVLYWGTDSGIIDKKGQPLPYPMDLTAATEFVWNWLKTAEYQDEPDHDGSNRRGFRVYNENWGHVGGNHYAFVGILPEWQMYGK